MPQKFLGLGLTGMKLRLGEIMLALGKPSLNYPCIFPPFCMASSVSLRRGYPLHALCGPTSGRRRRRAVLQRRPREAQLWGGYLHGEPPTKF